jgi:hypothetical protein
MSGLDHAVDRIAGRPRFDGPSRTATALDEYDQRAEPTNERRRSRS